MNINDCLLKNEEKAIFQLRTLYQSYGYSQYKMSKFEEYDLYVRNKDFLVSDNIITFTDTTGKLMALKPDVTLSIVKNTKDISGSVRKVYYNENVYRVSKGNHTFKEIMQVGLECLGEIDSYNICEVLLLAAHSLAMISYDFVLDISHLGIISDIMEELGASLQGRQRILQCIGEKNIHGIQEICDAENLSTEKCKILKTLVSSYGDPEQVLSLLNQILPQASQNTALIQLTHLIKELEKCGFEKKIKIDFSLIQDMNYYNGIVFKGFINGIPSSILSGGQYDNLMKKMKKKYGAIGFAVYLDLLDEISATTNEYDVDAVILYKDESELSALNKAVQLLTMRGMRVMAQKRIPDKLKYKQLMRLSENGVEILENNA